MNIKTIQEHIPPELRELWDDLPEHVRRAALDAARHVARIRLSEFQGETISAEESRYMTAAVDQLAAMAVAPETVSKIITTLVKALLNVALKLSL